MFCIFMRFFKQNIQELFALCAPLSVFLFSRSTSHGEWIQYQSFWSATYFDPWKVRLQKHLQWYECSYGVSQLIGQTILSKILLVYIWMYSKYFLIYICRYRTFRSLFARIFWIQYSYQKSFVSECLRNNNENRA